MLTICATAAAINKMATLDPPPPPHNSPGMFAAAFAPLAFPPPLLSCLPAATLLLVPPPSSSSSSSSSSSGILALSISRATTLMSMTQTGLSSRSGSLRANATVLMHWDSIWGGGGGGGGAGRGGAKQEGKQA